MTSRIPSQQQFLTSKLYGEEAASELCNGGGSLYSAGEPQKDIDLEAKISTVKGHTGLSLPGRCLLWGLHK